MHPGPSVNRGLSFLNLKVLPYLHVCTVAARPSADEDLKRLRCSAAVSDAATTVYRDVDPCFPFKFRFIIPHLKTLPGSREVCYKTE